MRGKNRNIGAGKYEDAEVVQSSRLGKKETGNRGLRDSACERGEILGHTRVGGVTA